MRIIAGQYKGRQLVGARNRSIRPTTSRIKEYIYQLLGDFVVDAEVLDLFSGSGSLGLEALSRGAASVTFVDTANSSLKVLRRNLAALAPDRPCLAVHKDAVPFLRDNTRPFDLVFADPPFKWNRFADMLPLLFSGPTLRPDGIFVLESERTHEIDWETPDREVLRQKQFDRSIITFFRHRGTS